MRRMDRKRDRAFALSLIDRCTHGVMALSTDSEPPYCLPLSFVRIDDALYFHCAREGRKTELLRTAPHVCITFVGRDDPAFVPPDTYTTYFQSAIVTGTAVEVTDEAEKTLALEALCRKLTPTHMGAPFQQAVRRSLSATAVWRVALETVSGKEKA